MSTLDDLVLPHPSDSWMCLLLATCTTLTYLYQNFHMSAKKHVLDEHAGCVHIIVLKLKPFNPEISNI